MRIWRHQLKRDTGDSEILLDSEFAVEASLLVNSTLLCTARNKLVGCRDGATSDWM